jgi:hypothetical protein
LAEPLWAALAVGDVVLARDYDRDGDFVGWCEAVQLAPADGDAFTRSAGATIRSRGWCGASVPSSRRCTRAAQRPR